ncbi:hypothetical protein QFC21_006251 [Naganishia friedmannii]|uniref:Uncharacterized protein n=1 Tax=Naganishia friedmannii TaxID=89922 RepID=A0ACC2V3G0_9TREE|nr:hypothetical protein QFC21_006251 [Naganishia friedmannii]
MALKTSTKQPNGDPQVGLFHNSLQAERKTVFKMAFILNATQTVYFGAYYRQTENAYRLTCLILDLDSAASTFSHSTLSPSATTGGAYTALLGPLITSAAQNYLATRSGANVNSTSWSLGYQFPSTETLAQFSLPVRGSDGAVTYTPGINASEWARERVNEQDVWAVVLVNGNATMDALHAINGGEGYDPTGAVTFIYTEARNFYAANQYIATQIITLLNSATQRASLSLLTTTVLNPRNSSTGIPQLAAADPTSLSYAFGYNEHNLQPLNQLAGEAATTAGAIYLIIFTFLISLVFKPVFESVRHKLSLGSEVALKVLVPVVGYFWISLHYSLNWVTMSGLGLVMEFMLETLGLPFFPFFLLFCAGSVVFIRVYHASLEQRGRHEKYNVWHQESFAAKLLRQPRPAADFLLLYDDVDGV